MVHYKQTGITKMTTQIRYFEQSGNDYYHMMDFEDDEIYLVNKMVILLSRMILGVMLSITIKLLVNLH